MSKLKLKDKTEIIVIEESVSDSQFKMNCEASEMATLYDKLNQSNLARIEFLNEIDEIMAIFTNKDKVSCSYQDGIATFNLRTIDATEQRLVVLEDALAELSLIVLEGGME